MKKNSNLILILSEDLLDTSILDADEPTDEELSDIEVDGLMEDVYNLVNELDSYIEELW